MAWNGVGLVLAELKKFEDARNAFARAIQARPDFAEAHYNLGFTLSNLGDFEGALRETKRALELDPYYTPQKFELAIDVEYEDPDLSIAPELGGGERDGGERRETSPSMRRCSTRCSRSSRPTLRSRMPKPRRRPWSGAEQHFVLAHDYLAKGMLDRAAAEANRALARGAPTRRGLR